jgi:antitoxin VapB
LDSDKKIHRCQRTPFGRDSKVTLEPIESPLFDVDAWRARLDAMGAESFLPEALKRYPSLTPDESISFD